MKAADASDKLWEVVHEARCATYDKAYPKAVEAVAQLRGVHTESMAFLQQLRGGRRGPVHDYLLGQNVCAAAGDRASGGACVQAGKVQSLIDCATARRRECVWSLSFPLRGTSSRLLWECRSNG